MIKFSFPALALRKAREAVRAAERGGRTAQERDRLCQESTGLTYQYLSRVGKRHRHPSNRVLLNLGLELVLRDPATGEEEKINLAEEAPWDWNFMNPRLRASSTTSSGTPPADASTTSE